MKHYLLLAIFNLLINFLTAQTTTFNYLNSNLITTSCNVFNPAVNINNSIHSSHAGGVTFSSANGLALSTVPNQSPQKGTAFVISYLFTTGSKYKISITARGKPELKLSACVVPNLNQFPTSGANVCVADGQVSNYNTVGLGQFSFATTTSFAIYNSPEFEPTSTWGNLIIWAKEGLPSLALDALNISSISITKTPVLNFTLSPTSLNVSCGVQIAQTFTVTNVNNTSGTISYNWNLGTANNGWLYNNSPAPQTFSTNTNSINLTRPANSAVLSNVSVTVILNGVAVSTRNCIVTTNNPPTFIVSGPDEICTSELYGIGGLPQGSSVTWSTSNQSVVSINSSGLATKVSGGNAFVAAIVSLPGGCPNSVVPKTVRVGAVSPAGIVFENENPLCLGERYPRGVKVSSVSNPVVGALYEWRVNNIVRGNNETTINIIDSWCVNGTNTVSARAFLCNEWSTPFTISFEAEYCAPEGLRRFSISPNPASDMISVQSKSINTIKEIRVKDKLGNVKLIRKFTNGIKNGILEIGSLPPEIYFIEIFDGKVWYVEKIIKR